MNHIHVVIRSCDRPQALGNLLDDIERDGSMFPIHVSVYDDASRPEGMMTEVRQRLLAGAGQWVTAEQRHGRRGQHRWMTRIFEDLRGAMGSHDYAVFLEDDLRLCERFFARAVDMWRSIQDPARGALSLMVDNDAGERRWVTDKPRSHNHHTIHTGWVDGPFICERPTLAALDWKVPEPATKTMDNPHELSSGVSREITLALHRAALDGLYHPAQSLIAHAKVPSSLNPALREQRRASGHFIDGAQAHQRLCHLERVEATMVCTQRGERGGRHMWRVIDSLYPMVDLLRLYLGPDVTAPPWLSSYSRVVVRTGNNRGAAARFAWADEAIGLQLVVDDVFHFPANFVETLRAAVDRYLGFAVVGLAGERLGSKPWRAELGDAVGAPDAQVHVLSTRAIMYHAGHVTIRDGDMPEYATGEVLDAFLAVKMQADQVPMYSVCRPPGWLLTLPHEPVFEPSNSPPLAAEVLGRVQTWTLPPRRKVEQPKPPERLPAPAFRTRRYK